MSVEFLPGEPNASPNACSFVNWNTIQILAYTSGNNLVILTNNSKHLQTLYLPEDSNVVDINKANGKIAIAIRNEVYVYTPIISNFYNFNFHGRKNLDELKIEWELEIIIKNQNDDSTINCLSWSDYSPIADSDLNIEFLDLPPEFNSKTMCELVTGSDTALTMHKLSYSDEAGQKKIKNSLLWCKKQPNPIYKVKFSPNSTCIASIGFYDTNVKLWHRLGFTSDFADFELTYLKHDTYVTDIIWKKHMIDINSNNSYDSSLRSVQLTPSNSFLLKPANSIIKTDHRLFSSENSSLHSLARKEGGHNILYTVTNNSILQVYSIYKLSGSFEVLNCGSLDLFEGDPEKRSQGITKSVTFIDNPYLEMGLEKMLASLKSSNNSLGTDEAIQKQTKLSEYIKLKTELCIVIGSDGMINLYGLKNLCSSVPTNMSTFKINKINYNGKSYRAQIKLSKYCLPFYANQILFKGILMNHYSNNMALTLVVHDTFKNAIRAVGLTFDELLQFEKENIVKDSHKVYEKKTKHIGVLRKKYTGHNKSVRALIRSDDGSSILALTRFNENYLWSPLYLANETPTLTKISTINTPDPVINAAIWKNGRIVFALIKDRLLCYDSSTIDSKSNRIATEICSMSIKLESDPVCFFVLPESSLTHCHIVIVLKDGICHSIKFQISEDGGAILDCSFTKCEIDSLPYEKEGDLHIISPVDPVGWKKSIDYAGRDVLAIISNLGRVSIFYVVKEVTGNIMWKLKDQFRTGIQNCSYISCSSINKMAIVDEYKTTLSMWDTNVGVMDYEENFTDDIIKDIDWTSTEFDQGILSVGFKSSSLFYTQLRYDYTNYNVNFSKIKKVDISSETTHEIGDSIWLKDGLLVTGAGNQLYISDKTLNASKDLITSKAIGTLEIPSNDLFHLCCALNGPLPVYHPQFIIQLLLSGRYDLISKILLNLSKVLREIDLGTRKANDFSINLSDTELLSGGSNSTNLKAESYKSLLFDATDDIYATNFDSNKFNEQCADTIMEKLQKMRLPLLTGHQQITLSHTVSIMKDILIKYKKVLDFNGLKFYLTMKLFTVNMGKELLNSQSSKKCLRMRDITFALHSDNKDILYSIVEDQSGKKINWLNAKRYGLPYWLDIPSLKLVLEKVAANEFIKFQDANNGKKDPSSCSIFYLALKKKNVLLGLWKNSFGHSERDKMIKFLSNDFTQKRWKTAASKNAYVLLGKHRYRDAASFFLLADSPKDAVNVIMRQLDDLPLAIAVARCYEGSNNGTSMKTILERNVITNSVETNNRWKLSWIFWILGDKVHASQALIKPLIDIKEDLNRLLPSYQWPNIDNVIRTINTEDPVLLIMFDSLRNRNIDYHKGTSTIKPEHEFSFVIKAAKMYQKMGCDWLALHLVQTWKFSKPVKISSGILGVTDEETNASQRRRPGDILSKYMGSNDSLPNPNCSAKVVPSILDAFDIPSGVPNILDSFDDQPQKKQSRSLLDEFVEQPKRAVTKSLLDDFNDPVPFNQPTKKTTSKPNSKKKSTVTATATPNMLDAWN